LERKENNFFPGIKVESTNRLIDFSAIGKGKKRKIKYQK